MIHHRIRFELRYSENPRETVISLLPTILPSKSFRNIYQKQKAQFNSFSLKTANCNMTITYTTSEVTNPLRLIFFNKRLLNNSIGVAKGLLKSINSAFETNDIARPSCILIELYSNLNAVVDVNIEPKKDDIMVKGIETFTTEVSNKLGQVLKDNKTRILLSTMEHTFHERAPFRNFVNNNHHTEVDEDALSHKILDNPVLEPQLPAPSLYDEKSDFLSSEDSFKGLVDAHLSNKRNLCQNDKCLTADRNNIPESAPQQHSLEEVLENDTENNEGDCSKSTYDKLSSQSNNEGQGSLDHDTSRTDEDVKVSRITEVSNPFTLTKLQASKKTIDPILNEFFKTSLSHPLQNWVPRQPYLPSPESSFRSASNLESYNKPVKCTAQNLTTSNIHTSTPKGHRSKKSNQPPKQSSDATLVDYNQPKLDSFLLKHTASIQDRQIKSKLPESIIKHRVYLVDDDDTENPFEELIELSDSPNRTPNSQRSYFSSILADSLNNFTGRQRLPEAEPNLYKQISSLTIPPNIRCNPYCSDFEIFDDRDETSINQNLSSFIDALPDDYTFLLYEHDDLFYITLEQEEF